MLRLAPSSITGVLILVAIAIAQTVPYSHAAVMAAETSIGPQHNIGYDSAPSDDWPTYHRDMVRSGYDPAFPEFTSVSLHWKSTTLDGDVYAEPLILGTDVIVATENNSLYELNATTGRTVWHLNLGTPVNGGELPCGNISPSGITGTPVIDASGRTIFVVAFLQSRQLHHELFAIDLDTGNVKFQLAIDPQGADPTVQQQRAALALANGYVYVAYGGLAGDCGQYHGWLAATNTNGGGPVLSYQVPTGWAGAIWGGGDGPVVANSGDLLVATGNSDATSSFDFGDAVIRLSPATTPPISLVDWFAPPNWSQLNQQDLDLGSTEPMILNSNYLFQIGKEGIGYLLNANNLGGIGGELYSSKVCTSGHGAYGGLAYSFPYLVVPCDNGVVALKVNLGSNPPFTVVWRGPKFLAGPPIIAGNAVWDVDVSHGLIYALSLDSGRTLFHDTIGSLPTHFNSLSAGDGQIFVSAGRQVLAYLHQQGSMTVSYSIVGGGTPSPPVFDYVQGGSSHTYTLTTTPTGIVVDSGTSWSLGPNPLTSSTSAKRWESNQPLSGTASGSTIVFTFYKQSLYTLSYSVIGGGSGYSPPSFTANAFGTSSAQTLTTTLTGYWFDAASLWTITNPLPGSTSTEAWVTGSASGKIGVSQTLAFSYQHQYRLSMQASPSSEGTVSPGSGWYNASVPVKIQATPKTGFGFSSWIGIGSGSFSGTSNPANVVMNGAITETANFGLPQLTVTLVSPSNGASVPINTAMKLKVKVTSSGSVIQGATIIIYVDGNQVCSGTTNLNGVLNCSFTPALIGHTYNWYATSSNPGFATETSETWTFHT